MRRSSAALCLLLTFLVLLSGGAFAKEVWMAPTSANPPGNDGNSGLDSSHPVATLTRALNIAVAGDTIQMRAGTYPDGVWMPYKAGAPGAYITVRSYDGDYAANLDAAFSVPAGSYIKFEGVDFSIANAHCINCNGVDVGGSYDKCHHLEFRRCKFHERDTDGTAGGDEIIKASQAEYLIFEDCEIYVDSGTYMNTSMALDFVWVSYSTMRRFYVHDFNAAGIYTKGGSQYNVLEQSVISNGLATSYNSAVQTGDGTGLSFANPDTQYETEYYVVRNNIFRQNSRAGIFVANVRWFHVYNNILADEGDARALYGQYRPYIVEHDINNPNEHCYNHSESVRIYNNIFLDTAGDMYGPYGYDCGTASDWIAANNNYYNNGNPIPQGYLTVDGRLFDPNTETAATIGNPSLSNPTGSSTTRSGWVNLYRPLWNSQSNAMLKDKGSSTAGDSPRPSVLTDIDGNPRPCDSGWDIGPYEYQGVLPQPNANFSGNPVQGTPPLAVQFTDGSSGAPTSWAWTFGDGGTSTAQHPSHTYSSLGSYTVSLTAYNASGQDTETKPNYIQVAALIASFTANPTWGGAPLAVQFTDTSTNSPTAWSWSFGDSTTSTVQSPSHTYNTTGYYTVSLTATNSGGSDAETKTDYIMVCTMITYTPTDWRAKSATSTGRLLRSCDSVGSVAPNAGTMSNLTAKDGSYLQFASTPDFGPTVGFYVDTPYTADQLKAVKCETTARSTSATNPNSDFYMYHWPSMGCYGTGDAWAMDWSHNPWGSAWVDLTKTYDVAIFQGMVSDNGELMVVWTPGNADSTSYSAQFDYVKFTVWIKPTPGPQPPVASFTGNPTTGAAPLNVAFTDTSTNTPTAWSWTFGDSNSSTAQNPSHTYASTGNYTVTLTATNAAGSDGETKTNYIAVGSAPVANFSGTPTSGTAPLAVAFTDSSSGSPTSWAWTFGDSNTSTAQNPSHSYSSAGNYTVSLIATNAYGSDGETKTNYISVSAPGSPPVANFTGTPTSGNAPLVVGFTDTSTNSPTAWSWTFGDSNTSTAQNPSHTYSGTGNYTVSLTATNAYGSDGETKTDYISVSSGGGTVFYPSSYANGGSTTTVSGSLSDLQADDNVYMVHASPASGNAYRVEHFFTTGYAPSQVSRMTIEYRLKSSRDDTPDAHVYIYAPVYSQHTTVLAYQYPTTTESTISWSTTSIADYFPSNGIVDIDLCGCALVPDTPYQISYDMVKLTLELNLPAPVADFTADQTLIKAGGTVAFTDTSTNSPTAWSWNFGDSSTSTAQNPSHTYTSAGNCTVALTATNAGGNDTETKTNYITVCTEVTVFPAAYYQFPWAPSPITSGTLADVRTDNGVYMVGDSLDPSGKEGRRYKFPVAYAAADLAKFILEYQYKGTRSDTPEYMINCLKPGDTPETLVAQHLHGTTESWDTWDTTSVAIYLRTTESQVWLDLCGCPNGNPNMYQTLVDVARIKLWVKPGVTITAPTANFTGTPTSGNPPLAVAFTDSSTGSPTFWAWEFGDGTSSTVQHASHSYGTVGAYSVSLTADNGGGSSTLTRSNYISVTSVVPPVANFTGNPTTGTAPLAVAFTDTSTNTPTSWSWSFGDSATSTAQNPSHTYAAGTYTVALTATNAAGSDGETKTNYIAVTPPAPVANFSGAPTNGTAPLAVSFTDTSTNSPTAWSWTFGDGNTSTAQNPSHTYAAGTYTVALTATNAGGSDGETKTNYITVTVPAPVANFSGSPTSGTAPLAVSFTDLSSNSPTSWSWNFGDANTSTVQNPSHTYAAGTYTVTLTAANAGGSDGETKTDYISATSVPAPVADFSGTPTVGVPSLVVSFTDTSTNSPTAWSWNFGDSSTSTAQNPSHTYSAVGNYTVTLTATNAGGSDGETKTNYVAVCTEVTLFPDLYYQFPWCPSPITSGTLADLRSDNGIYQVGDSLNPSATEGRRYKFTCAYAAANLAKMTLEYQYKSSRSDTPEHMINILKPGDIPETLVARHLHGTTDAWSTWSSTDVATYLRTAEGQFWLDLCSCPNGNPNMYQTSADVARITLWVKPGTTISAPTANFTGTPTSGAPPLAVTFTDSSTGSPTFWAWEFGDGTSSTTQSPSHTYGSNGTYSVSLTVNNGYGSNTLTRSNYITVATASAPTFVAAGSVASGTGAITPALPAGLQTNDILLLFLETANQAISIPNQNGGTWTAVSGSPQGYGTAAATNATRLTVFWSRYNGTQGAPTTSDSGNHQLARIIAIRGATTSGNPWDVTAGGTESTVDTSGSIAGATTTVANTLVVAAIATSLPDASGTANFSSWTNADLSSVTERTDNTVTAGNGGGLGIATGVKATAGAYTTTSVTCATATTKAMIGIAIKP